MISRFSLSSIVSLSLKVGVNCFYVFWILSIVDRFIIFKVGMNCFNVPAHVVSPSDIFGTNLGSEHGDFPSFPIWRRSIFDIYLKCSRRYHFGGFLMNEEEEDGDYNFI